MPRDAPETIKEPQVPLSAFRGRMILLLAPLYVSQALLNLTMISMLSIICMWISDPSFRDNCAVACTLFFEPLTSFGGQEMLGFNCFCL